MPILYTTGDLLAEQITSPTIIAHVCNDIGLWGKGFVLPLGEKYPNAKSKYLSLFKTNKKVQKGQVQYVDVAPNTIVANMIAQTAVYNAKTNPVPLDYKALQECLTNLNNYCQTGGYKVFMPKIGSGLAKGNWQTIKEMLESSFAEVTVIVFEFDPNNFFQKF